MAKDKVPIIVERHPEEYDGYEFVSLIQFNDDYVLSVVENIVGNQIICYSLDRCPAEDVDEAEFISVVKQWFYNTDRCKPLSLFLALDNSSHNFGNILRYYNLDFVSRIIGPVFRFPTGTTKVKKRKKKTVPKKFLKS